jgi:hypothetical protein
MIPMTRFLRLALLADAAASGATGLALTLASGAIAAWTALPAALLLPAGLFMIPYAALLGWLAGRPAVPRAVLWIAAIGNGVWAAGCALLPLAGLVAPNGWGIAFLGVQAVAVAVFAELYVVALRRSARPA